MFGSASSFRCHLLISLGLALLMAVFATDDLVDAEQPGPCSELAAPCTHIMCAFRR